MTGSVLHTQAQKFLRKVPLVEPGYTVRVHEKIQEGGKERVQVFEGLVISVHKGHVQTDRSFTVRKIVSGIGVERVFPLHSPVIEKIEVKKVAKTRRAKLFFIRGRSGKAARMIERFTTEGEFATESDDPVVPSSGAVETVTEENVVTEAPIVEETPPAPAVEENKDSPAA